MKNHGCRINDCYHYWQRCERFQRSHAYYFFFFFLFISYITAPESLDVTSDLQTRLRENYKLYQIISFVHFWLLTVWQHFPRISIFLLYFVHTLSATSNDSTLFAESFTILITCQHVVYNDSYSMMLIAGLVSEKAQCPALRPWIAHLKVAEGKWRKGIDLSSGTTSTRRNKLQQQRSGQLKTTIIYHHSIKARINS